MPKKDGQKHPTPTKQGEGRKQHHPKRGAREPPLRFMDPMARQHTATHHGDCFEELLEVVLEFANNAVVNGGPSSTQIEDHQHRHEEEREAT